jgi:DNA-binding NtrC family response regulator
MEPLPNESRGRVLVADDDGPLREGMVSMLQRLGYRCEGAASAAEATARLRAAEFDVLISDINMPGNVGLEFIGTLPEFAAGLPVILLTGRPSVDTAARSVRLPVVAYLTKPPDFDELQRLLDQAIANHRGLRAMRASRDRLRAWEGELGQIEQAMRQSPHDPAGGPLANFLQVSLRQVILMLAELDRATSSLERRSGGGLEKVDHVAALRRTIEVLERTKQNFKSKDLADLRRQLEQLVGKDGDPGPAA